MRACFVTFADEQTLPDEAMPCIFAKPSMGY